ncbi:unnamed protein product [Didymodactylos carnosus]|uniref:Uncharacterized protein n=1 Tax=Didymodactylos carnosus TaxID=1234261 RepID=A0A8S2LAB0_9BILA|nr:unnamed protein product [Didymodactylos carnosus]CAF3892922.1 unnamed protein product [Didymodactylos carnosus]
MAAAVERQKRKTDTNITRFACFFDIDGVIMKGTNVITKAKLAIQTLVQRRIPVIFVSNTCMLENEKARQLSLLLGVTIYPEQIVLSQTAMRCLTSFHSKHVLISGQGDYEKIARLIGFKNLTTVEKVCESFPELDMVDHTHRVQLNELIKTQGLVRDESFRPIDAIVLFGEPTNWESSLQVITDLLLTNGNPSMLPEKIPSPHIPIIACNKDLVFKASADLPRFGHGAFLTCLEALYKNLTQNELQYTAFVGKPFEITFQYAEMMANTLSLASGQGLIEKIYFIGDNPDVDILGANLYNEHLKLKRSGMNRTYDLLDYDLLSAKECESILVCTGVYNDTKKNIDVKNILKRPNVIEDDVSGAVSYILAKEEKSDV